MLRPTLRCRLRSVRRCWLEPARRFWSRPAFDMAAVLRFGCCGGVLPFARHCGLRPARRCGLEQARGCWLRPARHSAAAGAARRAVTGACLTGCGRRGVPVRWAAGRGAGGGGGGGFGAVWSVLLNLAEIARIFTSWAVCWSCAAFSVSLRQRAERLRIFSILSRLSVSKNTTQDSGAARCLAWQSPIQFVLLKKIEDLLLIGGPNPQKLKNTHFVKNPCYFCVVIELSAENRQL